MASKTNRSRRVKSTDYPPSKRLIIPPWVLDLARGLISIALGLGLLRWRSQTLAVVVWILALYLLMDGVFDIAWYLGGRRRKDIGLGHLTIGILSCFAAGLIVRSPAHALYLFLYYIAALAWLHGAMDLWELVTSFRQRERSLLLLVHGVLWMLVSAALFLAPAIAFDLALSLFALFFLVDGLGSLAGAAVKSGWFASRGPTPGSVPPDDNALTTPARAVVFIRRSGAQGLGHVGWAFEWRTGWFNAGSVENRSSAAFAAPEKMDFWTTHSLRPVATMQDQPPGYDEFKVFHVANPHPKEAWKTVVWISRQPYSVVRRNCSDSAFDVLRSYGVANLIDTAQENVPIRWYDALPARSYPIRADTEIPIDPARVARLSRLSVREVSLNIPSHIKTVPPPWHARGGRAWYEVRQRVHRLTHRTRAYIHALFSRMHTRAERDKLPANRGAPTPS
jgi:uncharacterized membrane protein HdeD (DUF308 family)